MKYLSDIGINKAPENGDLDVAGDIYSNGEHIFLAVHPVGSIYMSVSPTNPGTLFGGTWEEWGAGRVPVGVDGGDSDFNTVEATGGSKLMQAHVHTQRRYPIGGSSTGMAVGSNINVTGDGFASGMANTSTAGGGDSENLQPYITCYMWKRTA